MKRLITPLLFVLASVQLHGQGTVIWQGSTFRVGATISKEDVPSPDPLVITSANPLTAGDEGVPYSEQLTKTGGTDPVANRLASESSPYLLQHAGNPVEWYPWGEEAFQKAREEDRPLLLSIGYSSCHWCHVMEKESFEDPATARVMNGAFVSVKVDREERPDIDSVYMYAIQAMTGHGGWPLTVFLTPEGVPFYGGTYFPPEPRHGMPSFRQVLEATSQAWRTRRDEIAGAAGQIRQLLARARPAPESGSGLPGEEELAGAVRSLGAHFDPTHGGFGRAPKFPQPTTLELLLHHHLRTREPEALAMVLTTLFAMARGGIRDHLGGGFHRYATDARWLVPHFEKMLYDNALLLSVYAAAWQLTGESWLLGVADETAAWLLSDMRDPQGGFYSARDADSEGVEGKHYVWAFAELEEVLGEGDARLFARAYDVSPVGNWEGTNILHLPHDLDAVAASEGMEPGELGERLAGSRARLLEVRSRREPPFRDEKVLAGWNGLVLRALADAGAALGRPAWVEAAARGLDFVLSAMRREGRLLRSWKDGEARIGGFLEDYAALGNALLSAHEATLDPRWLGEAGWCAERVLELFWDPGEGVFYDTAKDAEPLVVRPRDAMDNAVPSGNSLAVELLMRAGHLFSDEEMDRVAARALESEARVALSYPSAFGRLLSLATRRLMAPVEVAVVGPPGEARAGLLDAALRPWIPQRVLAGGEERDSPPFPIPLLEGRGTKDGRPTAYVCSGYACRLPVTTPEDVGEQLAEALVAGLRPG